MTFNQGQFDFDAKNGEDGYRRWCEELDRQKHAFESRYGLILGSRVRLQLYSHLHPIEGMIRLVEEKKSARGQHRFQIGNLNFTMTEIESIVAMEDRSERSD